jgi:hypothetical protein
MTNHIFKSCFKLNYEDENLDLEYRKIQNKNIVNKSKCFSLTYLFLNLGMAIFIFKNIWNYFEESQMLKFLQISTFISIIILTISSFLILFVKNIKLKKICLYLTYFILSFICHNIRLVLERNQVIYSLVILFGVVEILLKSFLNVIFTFSFTISLVINIISIASLWLIYPFFYEKTNYSNSLITLVFYTVGLIVMTSFSYLLDKQHKTLFYFIHQAKKKSNKLESIFEYINSGFILFKQNSIEYINPHLFKQIKYILFPTDKIIGNKSQGSIINSKCNNLLIKANVMTVKKRNFNKINEEESLKVFEFLFSKINIDKIGKFLVL